MAPSLPPLIACTTALTLLTACEDPADQRRAQDARDQLESDLLALEVMASDVEQLKEATNALDQQIDQLNRQLSTVNVPLLAMGLVEEGASGWLEEREGDLDRVVMKGPGPAPRLAAALKLASQRAPGLRVTHLEVDDTAWRLVCEIDKASTAPKPAHPTIDIPTGWTRANTWDEVEHLQTLIETRRKTLGVDLAAIQQKRMQLLGLRGRLASNDRLASIATLVDSMFGGQSPAAVSGKLTVEAGQLAGFVALAHQADARGRVEQALGPAHPKVKVLAAPDRR